MNLIAIEETPTLFLPAPGAGRPAYGFAPGFYPGMDERIYHSSEGVSKSMLDRLARSPAHLAYGQVQETPAMALGTAIHSAILEPETFEARYYLGQDVRRGTKAWETLEAMAGERIVLKPDDWATCMGLRDAVHGHYSASSLLAGIQTELSLYWIDPETGLKCRGRVDGLKGEWDTLLDLKTTTDVRPGTISRKIADMRYHVQDSYYRFGYECLTGSPPGTFIFLFVEIEPPYALRLYELHPRALELGGRLYRRDLNRYAQCYRDNHWPGYTPYAETIDLPVWTYREENDHD